MKYVLDNSNLAESYSGVTTPLTYSFASHVYREVYKHFCKRMGVSRATILAQKDVFSNLLCFVGYRMYYNLRNWHSVVSFLPAYKLNRHFFDKMLGVETDNAYYQAPSSGFFRKYLIELPHVAVQVVRITFSFVLMGMLVERFNRGFDNTFARLRSIDLTRLSSPELVRLFESTSRDLLARWWVPIANDFAVMVSTGITSKLLTRWLGQTAFVSYLYLETHGNLISLDPGRLLLGLVAAINRDESIRRLFLERYEPASLLQLLSERHGESEAYRLIKEYLRGYGSRVPNELKLESETLNENPELLMNLLQTFIQGNNTGIRETGCPNSLPKSETFRVNPIKRRLLKWLLSWVGNSIRRREETRLRRALIFGYVRSIFLAIGSNLSDAGVLHQQRDTFFLTEDEVFSLVNHPQGSEHANELIARRKVEMEEWKQISLARRIESNSSFEDLLEGLKDGAARKECSASAKVLVGTVASLGLSDTLRGKALVLREFSASVDYHDKVLVTSHTDPGWTIVFPFLRALIVERGGSLSHAAIVARELGIACVMGVENATALIPDGATVEINLKTGGISILENDSEAVSAKGQEVCVS